MNCLPFFFACFIALVQGGDPVYVNKVFDNELKVISDNLRRAHLKYVTIGDVEISDDIKASNVKLGDVTRIVRKGDATLSTDEDTIETAGGVGIDKLDLVMDSLELNGKTYKKVLVVVYSNLLSFKSELYSTRTECNQTYSGLKVSKVQGVMLYSRPTVKMNVTSQFIKEVVPFINKKLSSSSFQRLINKYLNSCSGHSTEDLMYFVESLFEEPSSTYDDPLFSSEEFEDHSKVPGFIFRDVIKKTDNNARPRVFFI